MTDEIVISDDGEKRTFTSAEVCRAVGLARPTFDAWMLRGYMSLPPGPGTGRARLFSLTNAIRLAVTVELSRLGIAVSAAAKATSQIKPPFHRGNRRAGIVLMKGRAAEGDDRLHGADVGILWFESFKDVMFHIALRHGNSSPSFTFVDVTDVAARTAQGLGVSASEVSSPDWLEHFLTP